MEVCYKRTYARKWAVSWKKKQQKTKTKKQKNNSISNMREI